MTTTQSLLLSSILTFALISCQSSEPDASAPASQTVPAESIAAGSTDDPTTPSDEVAYEPAYPAEVSSEDLSAEDVSQQETAHSHGDGEHSHDDGDHTHGEAEGDAEHDH